MFRVMMIVLALCGTAMADPLQPTEAELSAQAGSTAGVSGKVVVIQKAEITKKGAKSASA